MILHHEFIKNGKKLGKKMAIIDKTTGKNVPYSKALIASLILAKKFKKFEENNIGVMIPTSAGSFLTVLGLIIAGKTPVMINYSTGAAENCEYGQNKCGFKTIVTSQALLDKIECRLVPGMICLEDIMKGISTGDKLSAALKSKLPLKLITKSFPKSDLDDTVVILFTSGSEKEPKAVQLTHRNIGSNIVDISKVVELTSDDVMMSILPQFHVFGYTINFWLPLTIGMTAVTYANPLDYKKIPGIMKEYKTTMVAATPIFFAGYLRESKPGDFESLQTSPVVSVNVPGASRPGSIGKLLPSVEVKITDVDTGRTLPTGQEGKILVKGDLVMKGYYDDIEETSFRIKDGWYDTGDMGVMDDDGYLWHRGRLKRFVKIGGEMVSMVRTESFLEEILPDGVSCCVVEVPDPRKGARLAAAVTGNVKDSEIIKKLSDKLPSIAIPNQFIYFSELPKMGSGKMDFRAITDMVRKKLGK
jgi:acyl-[acyl-carrier-protein]-phospholipid O-acyltransferase/long-chain-fatty-acid--[acyl-carrier-protein] ligase